MKKQLVSITEMQRLAGSFAVLKEKMNRIRGGEDGHGVNFVNQP